jgi:lipoyl(octanoyl) transferase
VTQATLLRLGRRPYREVWALQRALHARVAAGAERETWIVVEHDPVVTLGRNAKPEHVHVTPDGLAARGIDCATVERGGDVTYHGPGQVVVYPIRRLARFREVAPLVHALEGVAIAACASFDVTAERWSAHRGIYVGTDQVCAIGLAVKQMTSMHGIALNADTALDYDRVIVPCGIAERGITSLSRASGRHVGFDEAAAALIAAAAQTFEIAFEEETRVPSGAALAEAV